jgi:phage tail sheath protein FI
MPEYLYPGVYVEEISSGNKPIEGVSTSTVGFLGVPERGPSTTTFLTSFTDYARTYGKYAVQYQFQPAGPVGTPVKIVNAYLAGAVEGFFQNGGKRCYVQRVLPTGSTAAGYASDPAMTVQAIGEGEWGNRVAIKLEPNPAGTFRLTAMYWTTLPSTPIKDPNSTDIAVRRVAVQPQIIEVFDALVDNPNSSNFYELQINGVSNLITVTRVAAGIPVSHGAVNPVPLTGGLDGSSGDMVLLDFEGDPTLLPGHKRGLDALSYIDDISLLCCPDAYAFDDDSINQALIDQCEILKDRFAILFGKRSYAAPLNSISLNSKYAAFYFPWINVINPLTNQKVLIPPGGHVAGIYARSDNDIGVHKDPANEVIRGIDSLQFNINDQQQSQLNPHGINALRFFNGAGNLVWGGRTTTIDPDWKYINVRRLFIFVEKSIQRSMQWAVFEINDEPLWTRITRSVDAFLTRLWIDGMLQGAKKEQAFYVKCDRTTMTQGDIDNGRLICEIGIAPVKPAEFVIFRIGQWDGGSSVTE